MGPETQTSVTEAEWDLKLHDPCLPLTFRSSLVSHGGGAAGSASGDKAARLAQGTIHAVPGALPAAQQTLAARRNPRQSHAGQSWYQPTHWESERVYIRFNNVIYPLTAGFV